jgi:hypothetical protein
MGRVIMQQLDPRLYSLVFDIGGVLVDWNPRYLYRAFFDGDPRSMEDFFHAVDFWKWNEELDRGRPFSEAVAELSARFPQYARLIRSSTSAGWRVWAARFKAVSKSFAPWKQLESRYMD